MQRKSLLPMLLTTTILLFGGVLIVHREFASTVPEHGMRAGGLISRQATAAERQAGIHSIVSQLDAFRKDDYQAAIAYQSSGLKRNFASAAVFRAMMKKQYPQFANYKSVEFGVAGADRSGLQLIIPVKLTGRDGVIVQATYSLVLEEKVYRVAGVSGGVAPRPGLAKPPQGVRPKGAPVPPQGAPVQPLVTA